MTDPDPVGGREAEIDEDHCQRCGNERRLQYCGPCMTDMHEELDALRSSGSAAQNQEDIRDEAVRNVDSRHGFTMEFSSSPEAHREEYDAEEERIRAARSPQDENHG